MALKMSSITVNGKSIKANVKHYEFSISAELPNTEEQINVGDKVIVKDDEYVVKYVKDFHGEHIALELEQILTLKPKLKKTKKEESKENDK